MVNFACTVCESWEVQQQKTRCGREFRKGRKRFPLPFFFWELDNRLLGRDKVFSRYARGKGPAILTVTKGGFIFTGRGGTGIVVARTEKGWSGPSAIGTGGIGFGFQAGVQVSELVIVLNTPEAVNAFSSST